MRRNVVGKRSVVRIRRGMDELTLLEIQFGNP
jgi:hypothetical protein